jgi:uncharacterized OB-fold protein
VVSSGADQPYWDALAEGRLVMPRCTSCGVWHWPAVWRCGACGSWAQDWVEQDFAGAIYTWTRTWHPFAGTEALGSPFVSLVVELAGAGRRRLTGVLEGDEHGLRIGAPVLGRAAEHDVAGRRVPAIRWRLEAPAREASQ